MWGNMPIALTKDQLQQGPRHSRLRRFFATARERHAIFHHRLAEDPPPWTNDPIFLKYKFCNVYRELDRVTVWLRDNWREPYAEHPNLIFAMALARLINWPPTLEKIGFPERWEPNRVVRTMKLRQIRGHKVYTGAYLLGSIPRGAIKANYLVRDVLTPLYCALLSTGLPSSSLEGTWEWFREQRGIGDFLAYEIVTDLRWTRHLHRAPDRLTWANAGPGALRGLTRLYGYQPKTRQSDGYIFPKAQACSAMQLLLEQSRQHIPTEMPSFEMREIEHWLCEYDKYERVRLGQGVLDKFVPMPPNKWVRE